MKIAVIGTGISGLTAAYKLYKDHDVTLYEAGHYVGGHANTVDTETSLGRIPVDTGFIVYNDWTYPNFIEILNDIGVEVAESNMSFSVQNDKTGLEWAGHSINSLFTQRKNFLSPTFHRMWRDILRFNKLGKAFSSAASSVDNRYTLDLFLKDNHFSQTFIDNYIIPMGAAIWSAQPEKMMDFPALSFLRFFNNHGLLNVKNRPQWRTIKGGSREYIKALSKPFADNIRLNDPVKAIIRQNNKVHIQASDLQIYDHVFISCHSNQALALLGQASKVEESILGDIHYQKNTAILHTDANVMPSHKRAWAAWNYHLPKSSNDNVALSYHMNVLQPLACPDDIFVSLNPYQEINENKIQRTIDYEHPIFDTAAINAQQRFSEIQGIQNTWFCGAYWRNGFHEDGVWSAIEAFKMFTQKLEEKNEELHLQRAS